MKAGFVDWTDTEINYYVFSIKGGQIRPVETNSLQIKGKPDASILTSLIKSHTDNIYLSVPLSHLTLRELRFPFADDDKIRDTIAFELEGLLLGNPADYAVDHIKTESSENQTKALAVCIRKHELNEIIDMFSAMNIEPRVITSLDLIISEGDSEKILEDTVQDRDARTAYAGNIMLNPSLNLRRGDLAYKGDIERFRKKLTLTLSLIIVFMLILAANTSINLIKQNNKQEALINRIQQLYRQSFPEDKKIIDAGKQFKGKMNALKKKKEALSGIQLLDIIKSIAVSNTTSIKLNELNSEDDNLIIKGTADNFEDVEIFRNSLHPAFQNVRVMESGTSTDGKITFSINMQIKTL